MENKAYLFDAFPTVSKEQWVQQIVKDLKGGDYKALLEYTTPDGITVAPIYTFEDRPISQQPLFTHTDWEIIEEIVVTDEKEANLASLLVLNEGATGIRYFVYDNVNLNTLLQKIGIQYIAIQFSVMGNILAFQEQLKNYVVSQQLDIATLNISVQYDTIHTLVATGNWENENAADRNTFNAFATANKNIRNIVVEGSLYHNAGCSPAYEIACVLAHANEYLDFAEGNTQQLQINIAIGTDYFFEIAKLRAYRKVFALLAEQYGITTPLNIHATTASRNLTIYDAYNNLLRTTTSAMAATIGGCDSLTVLPFDTAFTHPSNFSDKLARNIQLILKEESYFDKVADVSAGAFFIETLTDELAQKAWKYFQEIEQKGGFIASLKSGNIQDKITAFAKSQQQAFDEGKIILVGTNKYPDNSQIMHEKVTTAFTSLTNTATHFIKPIVASRLSEQYEQERLKKETVTT